jgi:hypothetical protein
MSEQFKNFASTQLDGAIDDSVTTITVDSAMGFTTGTFRIRIDDEIMIVTAVSGLDFTVTRHAEGTSAAAHDDNAPVHHILTAGALDAHDQNDLSVLDTYANKPAAGVAGRIFLPTDGLYLEHDNGSAWVKFGPIWPFSPPQVSDFPTWVNQGASTATDNKGAIFLSCQAVGSNNLRALMKAYPTPPFTVEMAYIPVQHAQYSSSNALAGLCIRNATDGKLQVYGSCGGSYPQSSGLNYPSATGSSSGITGWSGSGNNMHFSSNLIWVKYEDDGTNRKISFSVDGCSWLQMASLSNTDYLTPDQIGIFAHNESAGTEASNGCTFLHWKQY